MKANKAISVLSFLLVVVLSCISFVLSYFAIRQMTIDTGATINNLAFLMPFVVDGAMMVFSFSALRKSLNGDSNLSDMALVVFATLASISFNVLHAPREVLSMVIAGLPPLALFFSFERVIDMVRDSVRRQAVISSLADLEAKKASILDAVKLAQEKVSALQADVNRLTDGRNRLTEDVNRLTVERQALSGEVSSLQARIDEMGQSRFTNEQLVSFYRLVPGATQQAAADVMGVTRTAISEREKALAGVIHRNGKVEVLMK